jgi:hypothetical protein
MGLFFAKIYRLPLAGDLLRYTVYLFVITLLPLIAWVCGGFKLKYGNSIVWTPREQKQAIQDGVECLRKCDSDMFLRFTKQRLNIAYSFNMKSANNGGRFYNLSERYLKLGSEGIAVFMVQCTLLAEASPSLNRCKLKTVELEALKVAPQKALDWMIQHSFHASLINSYRKVVEKWEAGKRFQSLN